MADCQGNFTDETSDEINTTYRGLNIPNEEDENEEGIAEYLDLEFENAIVYEEEDIPREARATPNSATQTSVLRSNCNLATKSKNTRRLVRVKSTTRIPPRSGRRSSAASNPTRRGTKRSAPSNNLATVNVHAALDEINAKLAASVNSTRDNTVNDSKTERPATSFEVDDSILKTDSDSVDLFFQSMAQTIMTLPAATQARIKMDICKVIATAEMKYSTYDESHTLQQG